MKNLLKIASIIAGITGCSLQAIPLLQLDIIDGTYDNGTDTVVSNGNSSFELIALINSGEDDDNNKGYANWINPIITISAAIMPSQPATAFGSFSIAGITYDLSDMLFGKPSELGAHGIFNALYLELDVGALSDTTTAYNSEDNPGGGSINDAGNDLYYKKFNVDISGLSSGVGIHFDLFANYQLEKKNGRYQNKTAKAPFSHDAESGGHKIPDSGSTILLLGTGILGLAILKRMKAA